MANDFKFIVELRLHGSNGQTVMAREFFVLIDTAGFASRPRRRPTSLGSESKHITIGISPAAG